MLPSCAAINPLLRKEPLPEDKLRLPGLLIVPALLMLLVAFRAKLRLARVDNRPVDPTRMLEASRVTVVTAGFRDVAYKEPRSTRLPAKLIVPVLPVLSMPVTP